MEDPGPRPAQWNDGARSSVEPFLHRRFDIRLAGAWNWLVQHGELGALPDDSYNPLDDARLHVAAHQSDSCKACAVWSMLAVLWLVSAELYGVEGLETVLRVGSKTLRALLELRGCLEELEQVPTPNPPVATKLAVAMSHAARQLELFADDTHGRLSPDARAALADSRSLVIKLCCSLRAAGFSYPAIAALIGDQARGANARIRMRCIRGR